MKRILCYGDSNTWGYIPGAGTRYPETIRWPGVAAGILGPEYRILEEGLNGRSTVFDDPYMDFRNGMRGLGYALCAHAPLDLIVLSLGTNDLKYTNAAGSCKGLQELLRKLKYADACFPAAVCPIFSSGTRVLVISPIHLHPEISVRCPDSGLAGGYGESLKMAEYYDRMAGQYGAFFLNGAEYGKASEKDCVHMDEISHKRLGEAAAKKIQEIFHSSAMAGCGLHLQ